MGRPKWSLEMRGRRFVDRVAGALDPQCDEVVIVARRPIDVSFRQIFDASHEEPAAMHGVARALEDCDGRALIVAVDLPLLDPQTIAVLLGADDPSCDLVVPEIAGAAQMLCAIYSRRLLPLMNRRILEGRFSLKQLMPEVEAKRIDERFFDRSRFLNANSPADVRLMEEMDVEAHASR